MNGNGRVHRKITLHDGRRVILYRWSLSPEPRNRNLVCLDHLDHEIWRAELPGRHDSDCFVSISGTGNAVIATTYRGERVHLCCRTGASVAADPAGMTGSG